MERWKGRVALVTGGSTGIGAAIVRRLASHGLKVVSCARHVDNIQVSKLIDLVLIGEVLLVLLHFVLK